MTVNMKHFREIVIRDLKREADEHEQHFLRSSPEILKIWDSVLIDLLLETNSNLTHMNRSLLEEEQIFTAQGPSAKSDWLLRKTELIKKREGIVHFKQLIERKKQKISLLLKEQKSTKDIRRSYIRKGYVTCLIHLRRLLKEQMTYKEAYDFLQQFIELYVKPWETDLSQKDKLHELLERAIEESVESTKE